jgi:hypothetical protein
VAVSNGRDVVRTDSSGGYRIPVRGDATLFVVKPRGFEPPRDASGRPRFHYVHRPKGSPERLRHGGVAPTGDLPERIDFGLTRVREPDAFRALLLGDTQPRSFQDVDFLARDVVAPLIGADVAFGLTLGDLVHDDLSLFEPMSDTVGRIGVPWYVAIGNHDLDFDASDDAGSAETFTRVFGPPTYAFQVGAVHFLVLDDVLYRGWDAERSRPGSYTGGFDDDTLAFVRGYLEGVPRDALVVLAMHIPLVGPGPDQRSARGDELLALLHDRPRTLSLSSHSHLQQHLFLGPEEGWQGPGRHHHVIQASACGSWWRGAEDETGIPHTTMRDGAPNGWSVLHFDGADYRIEFVPARRPKSHQMNVIAPSRIASRDSGSQEVLVNVFAGSERSRVEMRVDRGAWRALERITRTDPLYEATVARERALSVPRPLPAPVPTTHMWRTTLPAQLPPGTHVLEVRETDLFGEVHEQRRILYVD